MTSHMDSWVSVAKACSRGKGVASNLFPGELREMGIYRGAHMWPTSILPKWHPTPKAQTCPSSCWACSWGHNGLLSIPQQGPSGSCPLTDIQVFLPSLEENHHVTLCAS